MEKIYNKLVRDRIPEIIERDGKLCLTETLSEEAYITALDKKIGEELSEYLSEPCLEELERVRKAKAEKRGGFEKRIFLKSVFEE